MKVQNRILPASMLGAVIAIMTACATTPPVENFPAGTNPAEEIQKLEAEISAAGPSQIDVLSPSNYENAMEALRDAKEDLADQDDPEDILEEVAESRAYLKRAVDFTKVSTDTMPDVVKARELALKEGAKESISSDFRKADDRLKDVAEDIETNDLDKAQKNRGELQASYLDLELRAIQRNNLAEAQGIVKDAVRADGDDIAPQSFAKAEKSIQDADAFIIANRHDTAQIKTLSDKALADARKLATITQMVKAGSSEDAALQTVAAQEAVAQKSAELAQTEARLAQTTASASAAMSTIEAQKAMDAKYEQARAMFNQNEAEVYRQGQNIVIRLRGLEFDSAKAQLKGASFPLLSKVNNVIAEFPTANVTVEGHTDSKGGKEINEKVSQARADAVKSYFESNSKAEGAKYSAIGYDFQKPLASNKTEEGRAQNRRVDIVIAPEAK